MKKTLSAKTDTDEPEIQLSNIGSVSVTPQNVLNYYADVEYDLDDDSYSNIGDYLNEQPTAENVSFEWQYTGELTPESVILKLSPNKDMDEALVYPVDAEKTTYSVRNLCADTVYYWQIEVINADNRMFCSNVECFKTLPGRRIISLDVAKNFRDLGEIKTLEGHKIKQGLLFRGGQIDTDKRYLTDRDITEMRKFLKIKTEIDLRKPEELGHSSNGISPIGEHIKYIHLSAIEYNGFVSAKTNEQQVMRIFADFDNYPVFFHCQYGADRTGTVALLLEALVGVDMQDLIKDYELTHWRNRTHPPFKELVNVGCGHTTGFELQQTVTRIFTEKFRLTQMEISNIYNILITDGAIFAGDSLRNPCSVGETFIEYHINMRKSQLVKSVTIKEKAVNFECSDGKLRIFSVPNSKITGQIVFDDVVLKYEYNPDGTLETETA